MYPFNNSDPGLFIKGFVFLKLKPPHLYVLLRNLSGAIICRCVALLMTSTTMPVCTAKKSRGSDIHQWFVHPNPFLVIQRVEKYSPKKKGLAGSKQGKQSLRQNLVLLYLHADSQVH